MIWTAKNDNYYYKDIVMLRLLIVLCSLALTPLTLADVLKLKKDAPQTYIVVKGDTLWDISSKFLNSPWRWPELWSFNRQISDPHWIYPGDNISLVYVNGKPTLVINKSKPNLTMNRHGRKSSKIKPIPTVSLEDIAQFLTHSLVVSSGQLSDAPVLVGSERNTLFYKKHDIIFANKSLVAGTKYGIYRKGRSFVSPASKAQLGTELELVGRATVTVSAAISRLKINDVESEIKNGHLLMPLVEELPAYFMPKAAAPQIKSSVIGSATYYRETGKHNVVIIDGGTAQSIEVGSVFSIYQPGKIQFVDGDGNVRAPMSYNSYDDVKAYFIDDESQRLPNVYRGELMVFRSFENLSYALVTNIIRPVRTGDDLINP